MSLYSTENSPLAHFYLKWHSDYKRPSLFGISKFMPKSILECTFRFEDLKILEVCCDLDGCTQTTSKICEHMLQNVDTSFVICQKLIKEFSSKYVGTVFLINILFNILFPGNIHIIIRYIRIIHDQSNYQQIGAVVMNKMLFFYSKHYILCNKLLIHFWHMFFS